MTSVAIEFLQIIPLSHFFININLKFIPAKVNYFVNYAISCGTLIALISFSFSPPHNIEGDYFLIF